MNHLYDLFLKHPDICTDTRQIRPGCLFFALKGDRFDGNLFVPEALEKGAAFAVADNYPGTDPRCIRVPDVLKALQDLAVIHRNHFAGPVFALTGSNGKTTTRELIDAVLSVRFRVTATKGNLNNHIGVPLSILQIDRNTQAALFEMGASHPGEIALLTGMVRPGAGLITNVSGAHLEGFKDLEGVKRCKGALYDYLGAHEGTVFVHADDPLLAGMLKERAIRERVIPYGISRQPVQAVMEDGYLTLLPEGYPPVKTHLAGLYNTPNVLAALAVGAYFGIAPEQAAQAVSAYVPANSRSQWIRTSRNSLIADAYNANPVSMALALENLASLNVPRKCVVLGDMLELGTASDKEHRNIVGMVEKMAPEQVFWVGPLFTKAVHQSRAKGICFGKVEDLIRHLEIRPLEGATVLIKGSNGIRLRELIASGVC